MPEATLRALGVIVLAYGAVAALAHFFAHSWLGWALSLPVIGALQNYLMLLHHEGAHGLLHPRRAVNDFLANVFCGFPFLESLAAYRRFHLAHHRHVTDGARDPEIPFYREQGYEYRPLGRGEKIRLGLLDLCGYHWAQFFLAFLRSGRQESGGSLFTRHDRLSLLVFGAVVLAALEAGGLSAAFWFWLLPQVTIAFFLAKQRGYREHEARHGPLEAFTRDHAVSPLTAFFLFPLKAELHLTHHRYPRLEWFRRQSASCVTPSTRAKIGV